MSHACGTLILHCIDFRFVRAIKNSMEREGLLGDADVIAVAGAAKSIARPNEPGDRFFMFRQIDISKRLHDIRRVMLMNHTDCGAYGGRQAFADDNDELAAHRDDLALAASLIRAEHPELVIVQRIARLAPDGSTHIEDIAQPLPAAR